MARVRSNDPSAGKKSRNAAKKRGRKTPSTPRAHTTQARRPRLHGPWPEGERKAMYNTMKYFLEHDPDKADENLRMFLSIQPSIWTKISRNEQFEPKDLSNEAVAGINQIIYARDIAKDVDIKLPQQKVTRAMRDFNDANMCKMSQARFDELQGIIRSVVPRMMLLVPEVAQNIEPSSLPENVQILIHKYLNQHLPDEVLADIWWEEDDEEAEIEGYEANEEDEDENDAEDMDLDMDEAEEEDKDGNQGQEMELERRFVSRELSETSEEL
ncbi:hypothetical protein A1O1_06371 [Capronia coronata CBS 617.96]|uniref:Uncharacterized protein n=1 Tax=Capronia coronata CBS 617.96 TaxID=1182541 RepID=W9XZM9_9EURO|nr:uncharacterized protein A1O1_06371 [Capronia coronata CBS 617.96]EXJ86002.1 hypothetical protein A1O1_06371 [Capronia coronata CBS 617.96]